MVNGTATGLLGVVLFARHGDRSEFFQDPLTYDPSETTLTPLGTVQENQLGHFLQDVYISADSSSHIDGIDFPVANVDQILVRADAAGEGATIVGSTAALLSGLFPPTSSFNITLANGTTVEGALGGFQFVPINTVDPDVDISLNSFTSCPNFDQHTLDFYNSPEFAAEATVAKPFLRAAKPFLGGRSINFTNMFNIFDFINVNDIHNATFHQELPPTFRAQAYGFANFHENGVFTDVIPDGIGNIAFRTILPSVFSALMDIANTSSPLKFALNGISYKPFISFFNLTGASVNNQPLFGIVDYASALALEVHAGKLEPFITVRFKNGSTDSTFHPVTLNRFGADTMRVPLDEFISTLAPDAINSTAQWCTACAQTVLRGCAACSAAKTWSLLLWEQVSRSLCRKKRRLL
ncbi:phosphoglycerate mutase-like protein [Vararia minispora EC-137]|uniref:Phosphoglycerate mutase-like protein n=1 Tax=Vararia minispora EC-137 TaxID=1314806 RepID=A0ACB8QH93_9AGAM|nr:phosphoglycerate mutase-like protein [Vararia minispora EC-137]